ncbi:MAG: replication initiation protein [Salinibacter sp.]
MTRSDASQGAAQGPNGSQGTVPPSSTDTASPASSSDEQAEFDETDIVVKANQLIRGRINWTKLEHRVVAMLVAQLKKEDDSFKMQRVHISELMDMAQVSSRDIYDRAEEICRKLLNQKVHVRTTTEDGRRMYQGYNCLSTCRYVEGSGYIEAKFNDDMKPFLLQLKRQFTMYRLQNFMQLSSQHSMRVYELIKMQEGLRYLRVSVEELREVLCCEHTYERFSDFKRYVLERARTEIKETCDVYFTYKVERDGRTPKWVHFMIHRKDDDPEVLPLIRQSQNESFSEEETEGLDEAVPSAEVTASETSLPDDILVHDADGSNGASQDSASTKILESVVPHYNLYATVLGGLSQEELDDLKTSTIKSVLRSAEEQVQRRSSQDEPATQSIPPVARLVVLTALAELRDEDDAPMSADGTNGMDAS